MDKLSTLVRLCIRARPLRIHSQPRDSQLQLQTSSDWVRLSPRPELAISQITTSLRQTREELEYLRVKAMPEVLET